MSLDNPELETNDQITTDNSEQTLPTDESVTKAEHQEPQQEVELLDKPEEAKADTEESEEETVQYLELDGEEHSLDDVRTWQKGHMMQSDYTKKTTALADERKTFDTERTTDRENLLTSQAEVAEMRDMLNVLVAEDEAIDWVELKEDDLERYVELREQADKRKEALAKVKAERATPVDDPAFIATEQGKLFSANPDWFDDKGKHTETYASDISLMNGYATQAGFTAEEFSTMTKAHYLTTILKAAKFDELQGKGREITAKRTKVPITTKPKATSTDGQETTMASRYYKNTTG